MQMIRRIVSAILVLSCIACLGTVHAQVQQARGKATINYTGKDITPDLKAKALQNAQLKAVEFYYAEAGESEAANFDAIRAKIIENTDRYILDTTVLSEDNNTASKSYTVAVRISLNVANLRNDIKAGSAVGKAGRNERSALAFLFVSRKIDSTISFDPRVSKRQDDTYQLDSASKSAGKGTEGESVKRGRVSTDESRSDSSSVNVNRSISTETGGRTIRKSSESTWRLIPSANLNQIFTQTFTRAGFQVKEAALVEPYTGGIFKVSQVEDDYRIGNDLKASTRQSIAIGMQNARIPFVAFGTLDVGIADRDPQTGLTRVAVTVNATILDITQTIPDTIASVGPVLYTGTGPTEEEAQTTALRLAANNAARELTSQLTNLGLK